MGLRASLSRGIAACLSLLAPGTAERYLAAHVRLGAYYGYDAARRDGPNGRWRPADGKADLMLTRDADLIRARARAMVRDNPNMGGALRKIANNVVYTGITPQAQLKDGQGRLRKADTQRIEDQWAAWGNAVDLWEQQVLAVRHLWQDGGFLQHYYLDKSLLRRGLVPLGLELLDVDAMDKSAEGRLDNGNVAYKGREYDSLGHVVAYYLWRDALFGGIGGHASFGSLRRGGFSSGDSVRVPAENCRLVMLRDRIGQTIPVSWLHSCLMTMHDFDEYQSSERIAARLNAAFAVFLKHTGAVPMGNDAQGRPLTGGETTAGKRLSVDSFISSGRIDELPPGREIDIAESKRPGSNYEPYSRTSLRSGSTGMGMSYESFSNDFTEASYASMRQGILEERRGYRVQQFFLSQKSLAPSWLRFVEARRFFGMGPEREVPVQWQMNGWQWVDPAKDATAAQTRLDMRVTTRRALCSEMGLDFDDVLEQLAEEERLIREAGLSPAQSRAPITREGDENV